MKLFKDKYTLTLNEVSLMFEQDRPRMICTRRWIPAFMVTRFYQKFMLEFAEMFNAKELSKMVEGDIYRMKIINRVSNILTPLYLGLMLGERPEFKQVYYDMFGRTYMGKEDLKYIIREIDHARAKLKETTAAGDTVHRAEKTSFEEVIANVEMILERPIDREMKLYQFEKQYRLAVKRAEEFEKMKNKTNG